MSIFLLLKFLSLLLFPCPLSFLPLLSSSPSLHFFFLLPPLPSIFFLVGSFSLFAAARYPKSSITSISNSATQRQYIEGEAKKRGLCCYFLCFFFGLICSHLLPSLPPSSPPPFFFSLTLFNLFSLSLLPPCLHLSLLSPSPPPPSLSLSGLTNIQVITHNIVDFDTQQRYDRIVSVEMFEHMKNYEKLLGKVSTWLSTEGQLFVHIFTHKEHAYDFQPGHWMVCLRDLRGRKEEREWSQKRICRMAPFLAGCLP